MIVQFEGENRKEAIINHLSLDLEEEITFFEYLETMGYSEFSEDELIESLHKMFIKKKYEGNS